MNAIQTLIHQCLETKKSPECVLKLQEDGDSSYIDSLSVDDLGSLYAASLKRLPKVTELYILIQGCRAAKTVSNLLQQITGTTEETPVPFEALWQAGVSLSWWLLGFGTPLHIPLTMSSETNETSLVDNVRIMRYKQGWTELEAQWMISQIHASTQNKTAHLVITKIMQDMPQISFFPEMPDVYATYERVCSAVQDFVVPKSAEHWLQEAIMALQKSPWRVCTLFFVRQGSVSHWKFQQQPRRKTERLAYVLTLLFDLYGEEAGLLYYLRVLNREAIRLNFPSLASVIQRGYW